MADPPPLAATPQSTSRSDYCARPPSRCWPSRSSLRLRRALLRRSAIARGSLAIGLALILADRCRRRRPTGPHRRHAPDRDRAAQRRRHSRRPSRPTRARPKRSRSGSARRWTSVGRGGRPGRAAHGHVDSSWDASSTVLTVAPADHWNAGTFHTVSVQAGALAASGQPLTTPARAVFLTRAATPVSAAATDLRRDARLDDQLVRRLVPASGRSGDRQHGHPARPADRWNGRAGRPARDMPDDPVQYRFIPEAPLQPNAAYRLIVSGVRDLDGLPLEHVHPRRSRPRRAPAVVRFRPGRRQPGRCARRRDLGPFHRPDGPSEHRPRRHRRDRRQGRCRERSAGPSRTPSSSSAPRRRCRTPRRSCRRGHGSPRNPAGAPLAAATHGTFRTVAKGERPARPSQT